MTNDQNNGQDNSKVVEGKNIEFEDSSAKADIVNQELTKSAHASKYNGIMTASELFDVMIEDIYAHMFRSDTATSGATFWTQYMSAIGKIYPKNTFENLSQKIIFKPYIKNPSFAQFKIAAHDLTIAELKAFLELPENYGPDLAKSGLYEKAGFSGSDASPYENIQQTTKIFPELEGIMKVKESTFKVTENPFQAIFTMPHQQRPIYFSITKYHVDKYRTSNDSAMEFKFPLNEQKIFQYTKMMGIVEKCNELCNQYEQFKKINEQFA